MYITTILNLIKGLNGSYFYVVGVWEQSISAVWQMHNDGMVKLELYAFGSLDI